VNFNGLDVHSTSGQALLNSSEPNEAHGDFMDWVSSVAEWISQVAPDTGLKSEWLSLPCSSLVVGRHYDDSGIAWAYFKQAVRERLRWLGQLPAKARKLETSLPSEVQSAAQQQGRREVRLNATSRAYVDPDRIDELKQITHPDHDLAKVVRLCEELNICFAGECYLAVAMLTRALIDHIPPLFGCKKFTELSNNYPAGSKSFKESMQNLENSCRKIGDQHLHVQIRRSESLPTARQVDFGNDVDVLLGEIARNLKKP